MFAAVCHFHPSIIFESKLENIPLDSSSLRDSALVSPTHAWNIRLGLKWIAVANALAYYHMARITAVKSFIVQAPEEIMSVRSSYLVY